MRLKLIDLLQMRLKLIDLLQMRLKLIDSLQMGEFGVGFVIPENFQSGLLFRLLSMVVVL